MDDDTRVKLLGSLVKDNELEKILRVKRRDYVLEDIPKDEEVIKGYISKGWIIQRELKNSFRMKGPKPHDILFEDKVWSVFAQLGFTHLNRDRTFALPYDKKNSELSKQIDVFAKDDESIIYVECKSSLNYGRGDFKKELESYQGIKRGLETSIKKMFPNNKPRIKFILATENKTLGDKDAERLANLGGTHLDEEAIEYYLKMFGQIGIAARYQLLGSLFAGNTIPDLNNQIPAIKGKMGNHIYYSFSIEPDKLLKIGYVLHRSKANRKMMPTYQRIIKKNRLKQIREFITEDSGFFPNSIIISLDAKSSGLRFDPANTQVATAISKVGVLYLPKKYRSAYIIDGQHRLYGYAGTKYSESNSIPVVAFVNLKREEQVDLFMQINENQKAVPKTLRETLNADLLWTSSNKKEQLKALCSRISIFLGEEKDSPFYNYVSLGEDNRVLTPGSLSTALIKSNFFGNVTKDKIEKLGLFYKGDLEEAFQKTYEFLRLAFEYLKSSLKEDWELLKDSFLFVNKGVYAVVLLLSDILDHLENSGIIDTNKHSSQELFSETQMYLDSLIVFVREMDEDTRLKFKDMKGSTAPTRYWRRFQICVRANHPDFNPVGLKDYIRNQERALNIKTFEMIKDIEEHMREDFKKKLYERLGVEWAWKKGVPIKIQDDAEDRMRKKNRTRTKEEETEEWDNLNLIHYREIARQNWQYVNEENRRIKFFEVDYTMPSEENLNKEEKTKWWVKLNDLRNVVSHVSSDQISEEDFDYVKRIHNWLIKKEILNRWQMEKLND
ncbi:DGQHR domain-containing protein [Flagellimonas sp.]|jgi:DNA sulfur modification protein DndB|uniref:DGQHR domain-containing protein n=1 Tax=Flagellimonas sp. TaxID=2058762 RepID=UPI003BAD077E